MTRRGGMDWEAARRAAREQAARAAEPAKPVYVRRGERSDQWLLRYCRHGASCEVCGDAVIKGERAWMHRDNRWHFAHEACRSP